MNDLCILITRAAETNGFLLNFQSKTPEKLWMPLYDKQHTNLCFVFLIGWLWGGRLRSSGWSKWRRRGYVSIICPTIRKWFHVPNTENLVTHMISKVLEHLDFIFLFSLFENNLLNKIKCGKKMLIYERDLKAPEKCCWRPRIV